jgi:uncharacterized protein YndB with AHSA1/START domain
MVLVRTIQSTCAKVYEAWTDPSLLRRWLAPGASVVTKTGIDLRTGGAFRIETEGPGGIDVYAGVYLELDPGKRIVMTWRYEGLAGILREHESVVEVDLVAVEGATRITLTHRRLPSREVRDAYAGAWPDCLAKLDEALH